MKYTFKIRRHDLRFVRPAKTSRNIFRSREIFLITIQDTQSGFIGTGECGPLSVLSIDDKPEYLQHLKEVLRDLSNGILLEELDLMPWPSIRFGLETAFRQIQASGSEILFDTPFSRGVQSIAINGLVWMNEIADMEQEARVKLNAGFSCIKFKVGALAFEEEFEMLHRLRADYPNATFRLDANGAFTRADVFHKLDQLAKLDIHSIEQPAMPNSHSLMAEVCRYSPIPVALDEELIGRDVRTEAADMLMRLQPKFIILKPNLIGGFTSSESWIDAAESLGIGWWVTSALESNVGLRAIAQWTSSLPYVGHQGLGTGSLYENNVPCGLDQRGENLWHVPQKSPSDSGGA